MPGIDGGQGGGGGGPHVVDGRAGQQSRLADHFDDAGRRGDERLEEVQEAGLDIVALAGEQLARTLFLEALERRDVGAKDELVDGLDVVFVELLGLGILAGPFRRVCLGIDAVNLLVVLDERLDGVGGELVSYLVAVDHVDVDNVGLNVDELVAEEVLVGVLGHVGGGQLGQHERGEGPDGVGVRERLGEAPLVLGHAVEGSLDLVDALEGLREPGLDLGAEDDID